MDLIMEICERIIVLNAGRIIAAGAPREVQTNPDVIRVYLGEHATPREGSPCCD